MTQLAAATTTQSTTDTLPTAISSPTAKLVYFYLDSAGPTTISDLADALEMRKLGLYSVLDALAGKGLVDNDGETYEVTT
jgi:DNA-binding MarR family transcriptional regulator